MRKINNETNAKMIRDNRLRIKKARIQTFDTYMRCQNQWHKYRRRGEGGGWGEEWKGGGWEYDNRGRGWGCRAFCHKAIYKIT